MELWEVIFWLGLVIVFYTFIGYGILTYFLIKMGLGKRHFSKQPPKFEPEVTFVIPGYNEERWIIKKILNSFSLTYNPEKIHFLVVTDGSNDNSVSLINNLEIPEGISFQHFHQPERKGKIAAVERIMPFVKSPIAVFTDANTMINQEGLINMVSHFANPEVGVVAGEKRIFQEEMSDATAAGEGIYWKYESFLKKLDFDLYSVIGAAGEFFAIRTELYQPIQKDSIIEDFVLTMTIASKGYRIAYAPDAYAMEGQSASIKEELKRKIRIAAGGFQAVSRLSYLLNPFKYGRLAFQFWSRRVFRWFIGPIALPLILIANILLALSGSIVYQTLLSCQILFYVLAFLGFLFERQQLRMKILFVPYYFCVMHYAVYLGFFRFLKGNQSVLWERAKRA